MKCKICNEDLSKNIHAMLGHIYILGYCSPGTYAVQTAVDNMEAGIAKDIINGKPDVYYEWTDENGKLCSDKPVRPASSISSKQPCNCNIVTIMRTGCTCGGS